MNIFMSLAAFLPLGPYDTFHEFNNIAIIIRTMCFYVALTSIGLCHFSPAMAFIVAALLRFRLKNC
jgi:hypothetical protein